MDETELAHQILRLGNKYHRTLLFMCVMLGLIALVQILEFIFR